MKASRVWMIVGAIGCLGVLVLGAFVAGLGFVIFGSMRQSGAYQDAMRTLRGDPRAIEALGQPIEEGWFVSGSINVSGPSGEASLAIPVSGPRGKGRLYVESIKRGGLWRMRLLELAPPSGPRIDLLEGAAPGSVGGQLTR
jgi:hypothetical protein